MRSSNKNDMRRGFVHIVGIAAIALFAGSFWWWWWLSGGDTVEDKKDICTISERPREFDTTPYYTGTLIDAHVHVPVSSWVVSSVAESLGFEDMPAWGDSLTTDYMACLFKSEGITKTFGFFTATSYSSGSEVRTVQEFEKNHPGFMVPFFMPGPYNSLRVSPQKVGGIFEEYGGLFKGIGELKTFDGTNMDNPHYQELYKLADKHNLIVMMHPFHDHKNTVEEIVRQYPNVTFLLHGGDSEQWIVELLRKHDNVYYSLDANVSFLYGWAPRHAEVSATKQEYLAYVRNNFESVLDKQVKMWKSTIEAYPDRFLWGTDRWYSWHFDEEVGGTLIEFSRAFIGRLAPEVQELFAYKNAEQLLGVYADE